MITPTTIEEASNRIDQLKLDITAIQNQLTFRKAPKGPASYYKKYVIWRKGAIKAMRFKQEELSSVKVWRRNAYSERGKQLCANTGMLGLLYRSYRINKRLLAAELLATLTPEEQEVLDTIQAYIRSLDLGDISDTQEN